jgi:hypothetical protein
MLSVENYIAGNFVGRQLHMEKERILSPSGFLIHALIRVNATCPLERSILTATMTVGMNWGIERITAYY